MKSQVLYFIFALLSVEDNWKIRAPKSHNHWKGLRKKISPDENKSLLQFFSGMNQNVFVEMTSCCAGEVTSPTTRWSLSWMGLHVNSKVWSFLMRQPHNRQKGRWLEFHPPCLAICKVVGLPTIWVEFQPGILRVQLWWWQDYSILKKSFIFWASMI